MAVGSPQHTELVEKLRSAVPGAPALRPLFLSGQSPDGLSRVNNRVPSKATIELNGYRQGGKFTFKLPFQGRRKYRGLLTQSQPQPRLIVKEGKTEQSLDFALDEVREARLVPVVDFKGRAQAARNGEQQT